jgi:hypothetical protein
MESFPAGGMGPGTAGFAMFFIIKCMGRIVHGFKVAIRKENLLETICSFGSSSLREKPSKADKSP